MRGLVLQYYYVLRLVIRSSSHLRRNVTRCKHCGIYFITDPRNIGRTDLSCPFGCREASRREGQKKRSKEYYQSAEGKIKKKHLNRQRSLNDNSDDCSEVTSCEQDRFQIGELEVSSETVSYLMTLARLIESRFVSEDEILEMLLKKVRQHSMVKQKRIDYTLLYLTGGSP